MIEPQDEKIYYLLQDGVLKRIDQYTGDWEPISFDEFYKVFRFGIDKLVKILGNDNLASAKVLRDFNAKYNAKLSSFDESFLLACEKQKKDEEPKALTFASEDEYVKYIDSTSDPEERIKAYLVYKEQLKVK